MAIQEWVISLSTQCNNLDDSTAVNHFVILIGVIVRNKETQEQFPHSYPYRVYMAYVIIVDENRSFARQTNGKFKVSDIGKEKRITYVLASPAFFQHGRRGRVSHASGFISGLRSHGCKLRVLSGKGISTYIHDDNNVQTIEIRSGINMIWWLRLIFAILKEGSLSNVIVCRWRPVIPFLLVVAMPHKRKNIWLEINSLTGIDSKFVLIRLFSKISIWLAVKLFQVILVSNNAKDTIVKVSGVSEMRHAVIPNGFEKKYFNEIRTNLKPDSACSLVYFGTKQTYYSWDMVYEAAGDLARSGLLADFHVIGFSEEERYGVVYHGPFVLNNLHETLNKIVNPVFILHADSSEMARNGSPMKMYEYFAAGCPVLVSDSLKNQCHAFKEVSTYSADDAVSFRYQLEQIINNYEHFCKLSAESKIIAFEKYSWNAVVRQWISMV